MTEVPLVCCRSEVEKVTSALTPQKHRGSVWNCLLKLLGTGKATCYMTI